MQTLRVRILGPFEISVGQTAAAPPAMRKAQELLALLLLAPHRRMLREFAADQLWPDADQEAAKKAIRQALWQIHQAADPPGEASRLVESANDTIAVNSGRPVWLDATVFADVSGELDDSTPDDVGKLADAARLYRGPLMAGCDDDWCIVERAHFEDLYISLLDRLSSLYEQRGQMRQAIIFARRLLDVEPAHERSHRRLIDLYYRIDDRTRAVRQWRLCKDALEQELGIRPSKRTAALAAMVGEDSGTATAADDDDLADLRGEIAALQRSVDAISARLRQASVG